MVPGPMKHPNYAGSHRLIKEGAALITEAADILTVLRIAPAESKTTPALPLGIDETGKVLLNALHDFGRPASAEEIAARTNLDPATLVRALTYLTLEGAVNEANGYYHTNK